MIEKAYEGQKLETRVRAAMVKAAKLYIRDAQFETGAPFARHTLNYLDGVDRAARDLMSAMVGRSKPLPVDAIFLGQLAIERFLLDPLHREPERWDALRSQVTALIAAAKKAKAEQQGGSGSGLVEGGAWSKLVCHLSKVAIKHGLPYRASKGTDKSVNSEPSQFVKFLRAFQRTFPSQWQRHNVSYDALAEAISKARRKAPKKKSKSGKRLR